MEHAQIEQSGLMDEAEGAASSSLSQDPGKEVSTRLYLVYASKLFPMNVSVRVTGKKGVYRIASEPYIPPGYSYPHFDVEAVGERFCASVFVTSRVNDRS